MEAKLRYKTIQEYLENYLYPSLHIAIEDLIYRIRSNDIYSELEREFNQNFFENKAKIIQKEKELLKLERGSDYSESDYEYFMRMHIDMNETKSDKDEPKEEFDPDFDDSEMLHLAEQELDKDEEESEEKFNPIDFLSDRLKKVNLLKYKPQDFDEVYTGGNENDDHYIIK